MSRDTERDDGIESNTTRVPRREWLKLAGGAAAAAATGAAATGSAAAADYETITVSSGNIRRFSLGDGDTLENVLIDITADGAGYTINASGDGWAIRNVGVRGYYDADVDDPIVVQCPNGGSAVIENVYLGDGGYDAPSGPTTGLFVYADHSGHIDIDRVNVQGWPGNGVYASGPGNHDNHPNPGGGGTIAVTNSYGADNGIANFRLGTDGSYCQNCVSVGGDRGYWGFYNETDVVDCDIDSGIYASDGNWEDCAVVNVENTRFSGGTVTYTDCAAVNGSSVGDPADRTPDGVPTTPEEAASGSSGGGGDTTEVAEDFSHNDVPGTYSLDTGAFTTTTARSTTGSYALQVDDSSDGSVLVVRDDMVTTAGNTYELDVYHQSSTDADMGFVFGTQSATSWSDFTGYLGFFESGADEIRVDYWENGSQAASSATSATWPLGEWLTVELDYRETDSSTITMTVFDASGAEVGSVSLADTTYDSGTVGWYNWHAASDWLADSWFDADRRDATEVAEDFSHDDVPGTYTIDTGAFTTSSTRSTSDSYALRADADADGGALVVREDMVTSPGNTYELDTYHQSSSGADLGFAFGTQSATSWSDFTGYLGFFETGADEIRVDRWEDGAQVASAATATTWPLDEWLTVELDYRDTDSSTITMTVFDAAGAEVGSVSLADTTFGTGTVGWYNYHAASDWYADSWFQADGGGGSGTVVDDFEDGDVAEYDFDRGASGASVVSSPTHSGSYALEYAGTYVEAISTSGLDAYPSAGDTFSFWVRGSGGADLTNLTYGVQDHANRYFVRVNVAEDKFKLYKWEGDSTPGPLDKQTSGFTLSQDAWYRVTVEWGTDGTHTATLYDAAGSQLAQISGSDATWTAGGVGYDAYLSSGQYAYFDDVRIE